MKKCCRQVLLVLALLLIPHAAQAAEMVQVSLPTFAVTLNGVQATAPRASIPF